MTTLTRDQFIARLVNLHPLVVHPDRQVFVKLRDERVPAVFFEEFRAKGLVEEVGPGEWMPSDKGRRLMRVPTGPA
jgi:hypothetical protein